VIESPPARSGRGHGRIAGLGAHLLTAGGSVVGLLALQFIAQERFKAALLCMAGAALLDGVDGPLARRLDVARTAPRIDGALLDNLVDYLNYVVVPAWLILRAGVLPATWDLAGAAFICVGSALQFSHVEAKTADHCFRGFPSCWNAVAAYLLLLGLPSWLALACVGALGVALFVPVRYVHPWRAPQLRTLTRAATLAWGAALLALLVTYPDCPRWLVGLSFGYPAYYVALSIALTARRRE
jgi:phosphatidylcholine synthase